MSYHYPVVCLLSAAPSAPNMLKVERVTGDSVTPAVVPPTLTGGRGHQVRDRQNKKDVSMRGDVWEEIGRVSGTSTTFTATRLREGQPIADERML